MARWQESPPYAVSDESGLVRAADRRRGSGARKTSAIRGEEKAFFAEQNGKKETAGSRRETGCDFEVVSEVLERGRGEGGLYRDTCGVAGERGRKLGQVSSCLDHRPLLGRRVERR